MLGKVEALAVKQGIGNSRGVWVVNTGRYTGEYTTGACVVHLHVGCRTGDNKCMGAFCCLQICLFMRSSVGRGCVRWCVQP